MLLEDFLADSDFRQVHTITVRAPAEYVFRSLKGITPAQIPLFRGLFVIRTLPARLLGKGEPPLAGGQPILEQMLNTGFVLLAEETGRELVVGTVGQFWKLKGAPFKVANELEFLAFDRPDYAKAVMNFYMRDDEARGITTVSTETRIQIPDINARRKFAAYWLMIRWGSGLIRRTWLSALKQCAEREWGQRSV